MMEGIFRPYLYEWGGMKWAMTNIIEIRISIPVVSLVFFFSRSFQGMSCLIQVSTHSKDYIIDPFDIWADLTLFNEITADLKIVKVGMILR
jgi:hypothetical protein